MRNNIKNRLLGHFADGNVLSIRNMYLVNITNPAREVAKNFEAIHNVKLNRKRIDWNHQGISGYFYEYSLSAENLSKIIKIRNKLIQ